MDGLLRHDALGFLGLVLGFSFVKFFSHIVSSASNKNARGGLVHATGYLPPSEDP